MYWNSDPWYRKQVKDALAHFDKESLYLDDHEISIVKDLVEALSIVEAVSRDLCGRKETLASADKVKIYKNNSEELFLTDRMATF